MTGITTLIDISEEVENDNVEEIVASEPDNTTPTPASISLSFSLPPVTPWPLPLPLQPPGLRQAAEQANAGLVFQLWDILTSTTSYCMVSQHCPSMVTIITVDNTAWDKYTLHGKVSF